MAADERPKGLTVQELIHQLSAEYMDPTERPIIFTRYFVDDKASRRCVITGVTARAGRVDIDFEPEEWPDNA